jgi:hypothetical protein
MWILSCVVILQVRHADDGGNTGEDSKTEDTNYRDLPSAGHLQLRHDITRNKGADPVGNGLYCGNNVADSLETDCCLTYSPMELLTGLEVVHNL